MSHHPADGRPIMDEIVDREVVGKYTGQVKWFNDRLGYGFCTICEGPEKGRDIFVHHTGICPVNSNYKTLRKGEYVNLNLTNGHNGPQAVDVTGICGGSLMCDVQPPAPRGGPAPAHAPATAQAHAQAQDGVFYGAGPAHHHHHHPPRGHHHHHQHHHHQYGQHHQYGPHYYAHYHGQQQAAGGGASAEGGAAPGGGASAPGAADAAVSWRSEQK